MLGCADRDEGKIDVRAFKAPQGGCFDIALLDDDVGAHSFERLEVKVDRTDPDGASARQRYGRMAYARQ